MSTKDLEASMRKSVEATQRNFNTILEDTNRRQQQKQAYEANLKKKTVTPKV